MKRFLIVFILFIGLFSVSNAEFEMGVTRSGSQIDSKKVSTQVIPGYSTATIFTTVFQYLKENNSAYEPQYNQLLVDIVNAGYDYVTFSSGKIFILKNADFGLRGDYFFVTNKLEGDYVIFCPTNSNGYAYYYTGTTCYYRNLTSGDTIVNSSISVKELVYVSSSSVRWDGNYTFELAPPLPDTPDYSSDLASLLSAITSSSVVQDNTDMTDREYFIIPYGSIAGKPLYEVYFYNSRINLSAFEYLGNDENLYYDLDKISIDGVIAKLVDYFGVRGNYSYTNGEYFSVLYDSTLGTSDISYNGQFSFDDYLMKGLSSKNNPIIYTTKDITFYHYVKDETTGEWVATADESKNIVNELITDSGGNEISPVVPGSETPLSQTPWERVISVIKTVPESILSGLKKLFIPDLTYLQGTLDKLNTKLGFITQAREIVEDVTNSIELNPIAPPSISIDLTNANSKYNWGTGAICLDLSWYEPYKPAVDFLIICFCYGFFFWNLFRKLPDIINGISGDVPLMSYQSQRISNNSKRDSIGFKTK